MRNLFTSRILPPFNLGIAPFILILFFSNSLASTYLLPISRVCSKTFQISSTPSSFSSTAQMFYAWQDASYSLLITNPGGDCVFSISLPAGASVISFAGNITVNASFVSDDTRHEECWCYSNDYYCNNVQVPSGSGCPSCYSGSYLPGSPFCEEHGDPPASCSATSSNTSNSYAVSSTSYLSNCGRGSGTAIVSVIAGFNLTIDSPTPPTSPSCTIEQIATIDSAYFTGVHANPPRYELFKLPSNCPKTVIPASQLPDSWIPWVDPVLNEQLNVAVSINEFGDIVDEGWGDGYTPGIFVPGNQTMEQLGCETDEEGYLVFCSEISPNDPPVKVTGPWPRDPNRDPDTVWVYGGGGGGGGGSSSSGNGDFNSQLRSWKEMLEGVIRQNVPTPPNPLPLLQKIYDKIVDFKDFVVDLFDPQEDPEIPDPDFDFEIEKPELDTNIVVDDLDSLKFPSLDSLLNDSLKIETQLDTNIADKFKKQLDSLLPDTTQIVDKTKEKLLLTYKEMAEEIKAAVEKAMEPVRKALPKGEGACNCLEAEFRGLSFGVMKGKVTVGSMVDTKIICENINVIRRIIMVIVAVMAMGMILATLRGGN